MAKKSMELHQEEEIGEGEFQPSLLHLDAEYSYLGELFGPGDCMIDDPDAFESLEAAMARMAQRAAKESERMSNGLTAY